ncbi:Uncharacterised protein [Mycobacterium tuberculosis]|nr:Uncharacterised protein [Mycobacterium tuberculosis]
MQPFRDADLVQKADGALFEHARADPRQDVVAVLALENDVVDAVAVQQLSEQQTRRASADDRNLCPQPVSLPALRIGFCPPLKIDYTR